MKEEIICKKAPQAIGPYSQAVKAGNLLFISGQIPTNPSTGETSGDTIAEQTTIILNNIKEILSASGLDIQNIVKTTIYMTDLSEFKAMNDVYAKVFSQPYPARATVQVSALPRGVKIEIDAIAIYP